MTQTLAPLKFQTYTLNCLSESKRRILLIQQTEMSPTEPMISSSSVSVFRHGLNSTTTFWVNQPETTPSIFSRSLCLKTNWLLLLIIFNLNYFSN